MKYPKHLIVIRDIQYDLGDNFSFEYDQDNIMNTCTFDFPYFSSASFDTTGFRKYDVVKIYFKWCATSQEAETITRESMFLIFDGYIDTMQLNENKPSGDTYTISCKSTTGLTYERTTITPYFDSDIVTIVNKGIEEADLLDLVPSIQVNGISTNFIIKVDSTNYFGKVLDNIKDKYVFKIFQQGNGILRITTPSYFTYNQSLTVYDMENNIFNIDYGEITNRIDCVIVIGLNVVGVAFDPIAYQLKQGVLPSEIQTNVSPVKEKLNPRFVFRKDLTSNEDCQEVAKELLIETAKNYSITFDTEFDPQQNVGDMFVINNSKKIANTQKWIIQRISVTKNKTDIGCNIVAYSNSVQDFPEDILLSSTGILDTDILNVTEKLESSLQFR